jgi:hypothetical protein
VEGEGRGGKKRGVRRLRCSEGMQNAEAEILSREKSVINDMQDEQK